MADSNIPEDKKHLLAQMREWLNSQPHLPKDIDDNFLYRFVHSCYFDLDKAQKAADLFFSIRGSTPELMENRDPLSPQMQKTLSIVSLAQLKLSGNRNLWIWQLNDPGLENYDYLQDARMFLLTTDAWFLNNTQMQEEDIILFDTKDLSLKMLTKFNLSIARKISKYQEDALPIRLKQIHVVNAPSIIDKVFAIVKPLLKKEITDLIHFHPPKSNTIFEYLKKEELPEDFGGTAGKMEDHMKYVMQTLVLYRDRLKDDKLWTATNVKKSKKHKENNVDVPFRALAID